MSRTNDSANLATLGRRGSLADGDLDAVTGGAGKTDRIHLSEIRIVKHLDKATT